MSTQQKDTYFVAVKVFLEKEGKFLVMKDNFGDWDLPGGRIKKDEFHTSLEDVIARKMNQEVGHVLVERLKLQRGMSKSYGLILRLLSLRIILKAGGLRGLRSIFH